MERQLFQVKNTFLDLDDELDLGALRRQQSEPASRYIESQAAEDPLVMEARHNSPEKDRMAIMPRVQTGDDLDWPQSQTNGGYLPVYPSDWSSSPNQMSNYMVGPVVENSNISMCDHNHDQYDQYEHINHDQNSMGVPKMSNLGPAYHFYQDFSGEAPAGEVLEMGKDFPLNFASANASFIPGQSGPGPFSKRALGTWSAWSETLETQSPQTSPVTSPQCSPECEVPSDWQSVSTVMARNLPNKYNQQMLMDELKGTGFAGAYDFLYLPIDPETSANRGYAFINFISPSYAWMMRTTYEGQKMGKFNSDKVVSVVPAALQGFEANYAHYSTARVMRGPPQTRPLFLRECGQKVKTERRRGGRRTQGSLIDLAVRQKGEDPEYGHHGHNGQNGQHGHGQHALYRQNGHIGLTGKSDVDAISGPEQSQVVASQVRFCQSCGGKAQADFRFCQFCGVSLRNEVWGA